MLCLQALEMLSYSRSSPLFSYILFLGCLPLRNDFAFCAAPASFWVILQSLRKVFRADMKIKIQRSKGKREGGGNVGSLRCTVVWKNWQNKRNYLQTSLDRIRKCYGQTLLSACVWIFQKNLADDSKGKGTCRLPWYGYNSNNNKRDFSNYCKCH